MSNLLTTIQSIAVNAVKSTVPVEYCIGTVTSESPLKVRLNDSTLEVWGDTLMLTSAVVERKMTIKKHNHGIGDELKGHVHEYVGEGGKLLTGGPALAPPVSTPGAPKPFVTNKVDDEVLDAFVTEFGKEKLNVEKPTDKSEIVVTLNRGLKKGDKVIMIRVCGGQKFIILSRIFKRDDETE